MARSPSDWPKLAEQARFLAATSKSEQERSDYLKMAEDFQEEAKRAERLETIR